MFRTGFGLYFLIGCWAVAGADNCDINVDGTSTCVGSDQTTLLQSRVQVSIDDTDPLSFEAGLGCANTDNGAKDSSGDVCASYVPVAKAVAEWCGVYDDADFKSKEMCCSCGGGNKATEPPTTEAPTTYNYLDAWTTTRPTRPPTTEAPTCGGDGGGAPCVFPFIVKWKSAMGTTTYSSCTSDGDDQPWCATEYQVVTTISHDPTIVMGKWGYCNCNQARRPQAAVTVTDLSGISQIEDLLKRVNCPDSSREGWLTAIREKLGQKSPWHYPSNEVAVTVTVKATKSPGNANIEIETVTTMGGRTSTSTSTMSGSW